jgi:D-tyrosyl-tRNA(Tyr) deacylase
MRAVIQRVLSASVETEGEEVASIGRGLLVLAGLGVGDSADDMEYMARKVIGARVFNDEAGVMNLSVADIGGEVLLVSQFTLYGDLRRGMRPSYSPAMRPDDARPAFEQFVGLFRSFHGGTKSGVFGADMKVSMVNDGPVTILIDSSRLF